MNLPVPASVATASVATTAVESAADCSTANRATAEAANCAARHWASYADRSTVESAVNDSTPSKSWPTDEAGTSVEPAAAVEARATVESAAVAVEPRARADEDSTGEPLRAVVAVRRARIRVIRVVTVGARRSWAVSRTDSHCDRANSDAYCDSLRIGSRYERQAQPC